VIIMTQRRAQPTLRVLAHDSLSDVVVVEPDIVAVHWVVVALHVVHCSAENARPSTVPSVDAFGLVTFMKHIVPAIPQANAVFSSKIYIVLPPVNTCENVNA